MDGSIGATTTAATNKTTYYQSVGSGIDFAGSDAGQIVGPPMPANIDKLPCDIAKLQLGDTTTATATTATTSADKQNVRPTSASATKCRNCSCDINRKSLSEESAPETGIVSTSVCPITTTTTSSKTTTTAAATIINNSSSNANTVNVPVAALASITPTTTSTSTATVVDATAATATVTNRKLNIYVPVEQQHEPKRNHYHHPLSTYQNPTYLPLHFRNLPKTQSLDLADDHRDDVSGGLLTTSTSTELAGALPKVHPFDQNRAIYPNVPYSPYSSPYGSPRTGRRRAPLRESRRISIEQTGSFLQLNQYKLMDQIGQVTDCLLTTPKKPLHAAQLFQVDLNLFVSVRYIYI